MTENIWKSKKNTRGYIASSVYTLHYPVMHLQNDRVGQALLHGTVEQRASLPKDAKHCTDQCKTS
jgi:hypothetical protein